jgi:hypothetical protein
MYYDESTSAKNTPSRTNIHLDKYKLICQATSKTSAGRHLEFPKTNITFENAITFEPIVISTLDWHHFAQS